MLGYSKEELNEMTNAVGAAHDYTTDESISDGLAKAYAFLQGLWAEGYFEI
jgi:Holliday junction resolvasome RuvABC DNA-binding subunit